MPGHFLERCWKIHGYPPNHPNFKGKKAAHVASNDENEGDEGDQGSIATNMSIEQYNQLQSLLNNQQAGSSSSENQVHVAPHAHVATQDTSACTCLLSF